MPRNKIAFSVLVCVLVGIGSKNSAAKRIGRKPNIIFFLADDQGYADLGCFGATDIVTPNIDQLCRGE